MDDSDFRRMLKVKVKFRPTGKPERGKCKDTIFEAYCPICKKTIEYFEQEYCVNCEIGLEWDFAIAWD